MCLCCGCYSGLTFNRYGVASPCPDLNLIQYIVGSADYLPASAMFLAAVVALAVRPDMPIREAAANLIKFFMVISLSFVPAAELGGLRFAFVSASDARIG